jgi:hypothetical protein
VLIHAISGLVRNLFLSLSLFLLDSRFKQQNYIKRISANGITLLVLAIEVVLAEVKENFVRNNK